MEVNSWEDMRIKYPEYRGEMTEEREKEFINDCFDCYEKEGFSKVFWSQCDDFKRYYGKTFEVVGRVSTEDVDLECLPMWNIRFNDGSKMSAYPDEIILREMKDNGCPIEYLD